MPEETFQHLKYEYDIRLLTFYSHRIKPPDTCARSGTIYRPCLWLNVIFILLVLCPQVRSNKWSVFDSFARSFAESLLAHSPQFPRILEGFELPYIKYSGSNPLLVIYNITPNNDSWLYITPCSNNKYVITLQSLVSDTDFKPINMTTNSISNKGQLSEWYDRVTKVDMRSSTGLGRSIHIENWKRQEIHVKNLKLGILKMNIKTNETQPSVYMIRQYSGRFDGFYPRIPHDPSVRVCTMDTQSSTLSIFVSRAYNTDRYCATFNLVENLPNFCSAQLRVEKHLFSSLLRRENITTFTSTHFDHYNRNANLKPILISEFRCFKRNMFEVTLSDVFQRSIVFINIYAINTATEFADSYEPVTFDFRDGQGQCESAGKVVTMGVQTPHLWVMGNETVYFNISAVSKEATPTRLLYQGCMSIQREFLEVFERKSQTPLCVEIPNSRVKSLCHPLRPGQYRLKHNMHDRSNFSMPIGQIFLSNNIRAFPHLYCNETEVYSLVLHRFPLKDFKGQYHLNISFIRVSSPYDISYSFYILEFKTTDNNNYTLSELLSRSRQLVRTERNFCQFNNKDRLRMPIHKITLKGRRCGETVDKEYQTSIPGQYSENSTYAVLVYFRANIWKSDVQFYSNVIFTVFSEEDVF